MDFFTLRWIGNADGFLELLDQRKLPAVRDTLNIQNVDSLFDAIQTLAVRGAPAIGVAAAYGVVIQMQTFKGSSVDLAFDHLNDGVSYLAKSRPTAVNLFWALERMTAFAKKIIADNPDISVGQFKEFLFEEAIRIDNEDKSMCKAIGRHGAKFIKEGGAYLTHCNAGALATAGQGTALSVFYEAHSLGKKFKVYADETRPLLQGARITAWELMHAGIDITLNCDNMAGWMMRQGMVDAVIVGADRIASNGDAANKIGTYSLSVLAKHHNIPFYIAAPSSTFDLSLLTGDDIPIEQRDASEVAGFADSFTAPKNTKVYNPAFDVTPAENITAIITEEGIIEKPDRHTVLEKFIC